MITAAVILAAGMGKRMKSDLPKVLHPVLARPMVERAARAAAAAGVSQITVVIGHGREKVIPLLESNGWSWAVQEEQLGTAHAVSCALSQVENADEVVVLMGDVPLLREETISELLGVLRESKAALAVLTTTPPDVTGYGRVILDSSGKIDRIVEEKDASPQEKKCRVINTGIMAFDGSVLAEVLSRIG
ncbi:MAG: NTP transferase domain-containing protein, partial [Candidatus Sabulitectum sp.]|nr:NTP transferase domain-containing protein [Candidatus Sabulitectum sp.]